MGLLLHRVLTAHLSCWRWHGFGARSGQQLCPPGLAAPRHRDLPIQINHVSCALAGGLSTTDCPGKPHVYLFNFLQMTFCWMDVQSREKLGYRWLLSRNDETISMSIKHANYFAFLIYLNTMLLIVRCSFEISVKVILKCRVQSTKHSLALYYLAFTLWVTHIYYFLMYLSFFGQVETNKRYF